MVEGDPKRDDNGRERREPAGGLLNPETTPIKTLALWRSMRYFAERTLQDAKTELGWDEFTALKYRAWMHHTATDAIALWFMAETKLDWTKRHPPDPELRRRLEIEALPTVSAANARELLRAALPLKHLSQREVCAWCSNAS